MLETIKNLFDSTQSFLFFLLSLLFFLLLIIQKISFMKKRGKLRKDAIKRSKAVIGGQVAEQIAPLLPDFPSPLADMLLLYSSLFLLFLLHLLILLLFRGWKNLIK